MKRNTNSGILLCSKGLFCFLFIASVLVAQAQERKTVRLGLNYGVGSQSIFPFNSPNYLYDNKYLKMQINYLLQQKSKWIFELNIEPSYYECRHQLLNMYYVQPHFGADYIDQRAKFTQLITFNEYALNIGLISRRYILTNLSIYFLESIGPMIGDQGTERLRKGFAFSDIFAFGTSYKIKRIQFDLRLSLRHTSNAGLYFPNYGHNSSCIEGGCSLELGGFKSRK